MASVLRITEASNLAIHAMALLASWVGRDMVSVAQMARTLGVSRDHLSKVMQRLSQQGLVRARRGPGGGFALSRSAEEISLLQIVEAVDGPLQEPACLLGKPVCQEGQCVMRQMARSVHEQVKKRLARTRLSEIPAPAP